MPRFERTYRIDRPASEVFDVIGTRMYENHPKWEKEVVAIRPVTTGPIGVGSRAVMVRQDGRRRSEQVYEITAFETGRRITSIHPEGPMDFELTFDLAPAGDSATDLTVRVRMAGRGALRLLNPMIGLQLPARSDRISRSMVAVVEAETARA